MSEELDMAPVFRLEQFIDAINNSATPPVPEFREEFYLAKMVGMDVDLPEPVFRREKYFAYLAGMDVDLPEPVTRDELFLAAACGMDVDVPEAVFRDEFWLSKLSGGGGGGIWKTVTGTLLHITDALASPVKELSVEIEPQQSGTGDPSPTNIRPITGFAMADIFQDDNKLPIETYTPVEYLESDGNQYIDSGIECTSDLVVDFKFFVSSSQNLALCGGINTQNAPTYFRHHCSYSGSSKTSSFYYIQNDSSGDASIRANSAAALFDVRQWFVIDPVNGTAKINGLGYTFTPLQSGLTTGKSYGIFARIADTGAIQSRPSKIYYFKFYRNSVLIGNFLPCVRNSDDKPGMYDTVTKQFFTNEGTGEFTVGDTVAPQQPDKIYSVTLATGKNKFYYPASILGYRLSTTGLLFGESDYFVSPPIKVEVGERYTKNSPTADAYHRFCTYSSLDFESAIRAVSNSNTITIAEGEKYIRFCGLQSEMATAQVEIGSTSTAYEDCVPVYGGTLTVNQDGSVDLVVDRGIMTFDGDEDWTIYQSGTNKYYYFWNANTGGSFSRTDNISNKYPFADITTNNTVQGFSIDGAHKLRVRWGTQDTIENFKASLASEPLVICFMLTSPITYHLDSIEQIYTLAGENNIWADVNGDITLTYQAVPQTAFSDEADKGMADYMTLLS